MSTVVAVMDRPGWESNTDVIVVVRPERRELLWVPRDLWSERLGRRTGEAFAAGGHDALLTALGEAGIAVEHGLCVARETAEAIVDRLELVVPVAEPLRYWYPLVPKARIEDGRKLVSFDPPSERLSGERLHQWLGARYAVGRPSGDLERIGRQQVALREALRAGVRLGDGAEGIEASAAGAYDDLAQVGHDWRFDTFTRFAPATVRGKKVLVRRRFRGPLGRLELRRRVAGSGGTLD
jgi:hypothetical protein